MPEPVFVYSQDNIRARIVAQTLKVNGIPTRIFASHFEVKTAVGRHVPSVIFLDMADNFLDELNFLMVLAADLSETTFIAQTNPLDISVLEKSKLKNVRTTPEPIDPALILHIVRRAPGSIPKKSLYVTQTGISLASRLIFWSIVTVIVLCFGMIGGYIFQCVTTLPNTDALEQYAPYQASKVYSHDNILLTEFYVERRTNIPFADIPKHLKNAVIAVEDTRFYSHNGIDLIRMLSAAVADLKAGAFAQGASTITQQLAKMLFLKPEKTITRKIKEIALSFQLERRYSKNKILELYLNQAYFGSQAYGIEAASQVYFGKSIIQVTIPEAALIASLPKAPSRYSPFKDPKTSVQRRNLALKRMFIAGFITQMEYEKYLAAPIPVKFHGRKYKAPYFVDYCRTVLEKQIGDRLYSSGLKIYTTLDYKYQQNAERAVNRGLDDLEKRVSPGLQAALVAITIDNGHIKAMVGGRDFWESQFNRVTQAKRQPGSAFKPFIYLTALMQGFKPEDKIIDKKITYFLEDGNTWTPRNYSGTYYGSVTLQAALSHSLNAACVQLSKTVGMNNVINIAKRLGIRSVIHPYYSSALGASEVSLLEMTCAYAALACGNRTEPISVNRIIDNKKQTLARSSKTFEKVISPKDLSAIRGMLRAVVTSGTAKKATVLNRPIYGKTGTTDDCSDAWFIGFDDRLAVGVWVGRDKLSSIGENETGSSAALPIWIMFMKSISK
jgi:penicillin-binding protein 1A